MNFTIKEAITDAQAAACYPVMHQLRPALTQDEFLRGVALQRAHGYRLVYLEDSGVITCVAGFRVSHCLAWGKFLYVDDLVTDSTQRSHGYGKAMLDWLRNEAQRAQCHQFHLDSGVQRKDAHRFYEREGMDRSAFHFSELLKPVVK